MIFFRQLKSMMNRHSTTPEGEIVEEESVEKIMVFKGHHKVDTLKPCGRLVNMETGEIIIDDSNHPRPNWIDDQLAIAIKLAEWRKEKGL